MLTQEQINSLKKGDKLLVEAYFVEEKDGYHIKCSLTPPYAYVSMVFSVISDLLRLPSEHGTSVPTTAPFRLFKKGDRIRFKTWHGFLPSDLENEAELLGKEATVYEDQEEDEFSVHFIFDGEDPEEEWHATYLPFIDLITPVEELEPYLMLENVPSNSIEVRDKRTNKVEATFYFGKDHAYTFEQAATRAEAERDRLNAEWRKEQNND